MNERQAGLRCFPLNNLLYRTHGIPKSQSHDERSVAMAAGTVREAIVLLSVHEENA